VSGTPLESELFPAVFRNCHGCNHVFANELVAASGNGSDAHCSSSSRVRFCRNVHSDSAVQRDGSNTTTTLWQTGATVTSVIPAWAETNPCSPRTRFEVVLSVGTRRRTRPGIEWMTWVAAKGSAGVTDRDRLSSKIGWTTCQTPLSHKGDLLARR